MLSAGEGAYRDENNADIKSLSWKTWKSRKEEKSTYMSTYNMSTKWKMFLKAFPGPLRFFLYTLFSMQILTVVLFFVLFCFFEENPPTLLVGM